MRRLGVQGLILFYLVNLRSCAMPSLDCRIPFFRAVYCETSGCSSLTRVRLARWIGKRGTKRLAIVGTRTRLTSGRERRRVGSGNSVDLPHCPGRLTARRLFSRATDGNEPWPPGHRTSAPASGGHLVVVPLILPRAATESTFVGTCHWRPSLRQHVGSATRGLRRRASLARRPTSTSNIHASILPRAAYLDEHHRRASSRAGLATCGYQRIEHVSKKPRATVCAPIRHLDHLQLLLSIREGEALPANAQRPSGSARAARRARRARRTRLLQPGVHAASLQRRAQ
ncbi:unnamed protein product [Trichogramma brassicae]|uniref:Secreted protein n=1 Tax=Trichogramma brassicae TaxID=86971 RepID=A0A6H5IZ96_9HYME|nr:unnamed protein product [Trichogramma brassicae]